MHVKRHLSRLFGSFRKKVKQHKNVSEKVVEQFKGDRSAKSSSHWELLDADTEVETGNCNYYNDNFAGDCDWRQSNDLLNGRLLEVPVCIEVASTPTNSGVIAVVAVDTRDEWDSDFLADWDRDAASRSTLVTTTPMKAEEMRPNTSLLYSSNKSWCPISTLPTVSRSTEEMQETRDKEQEPLSSYSSFSAVAILNSCDPTTTTTNDKSTNAGAISSTTTTSTTTTTTAEEIKSIESFEEVAEISKFTACGIHMQPPPPSQPQEDEKQKESKAKETGIKRVQRKLSIKTLKTSGKGMRKMLRIGLVAVGRTMMHASAVMPMNPYGCPPTSSNYESFYGNDYNQSYSYSSDDYHDWLEYQRRRYYSNNWSSQPAL